MKKAAAIDFFKSNVSPNICSSGVFFTRQEKQTGAGWTHWCVEDLVIANRRAQVPADVEGQASVT